MNKENKQLLLIDLCARLPYGIEISLTDGTSGMITSISTVPHGTFVTVYFDRDNVKDVSFEDIKPYLRPMSSMTEEEKEELRQEHIKDEKLFAECLTKAANGDSSMRGKVIPHFSADWCNKNHFDYRGLIPIGLALEASEDMY